MGCGFVRMIDPILAVHKAGKIEGELPSDTFTKEVRYLRYVLPNVFDLVDQNVQALYLMRVLDGSGEAQILKNYKNFPKTLFQHFQP